MESVINSPRQFDADAVHLGKILNAGLRQLLQTAELSEQRLPTLGADTGDVVESGNRAGLGPALAMAGDGETMRFITDLLDQMQRG
jgi:hypothetical protein